MAGRLKFDSRQTRMRSKARQGGSSARGRRMRIPRGTSSIAAWRRRCGSSDGRFPTVSAISPASTPRSSSAAMEARAQAISCRLSAKAWMGGIRSGGARRRMATRPQVTRGSSTPGNSSSASG